MNYLYHILPEDMKGTVLYPLNQLKNIHPKIYSHHNKKYDGRKFVKETKILPLSCSWNDVIFLSSIHPSKIKKEFRKKGFPFRKNMRVLKINPHHLDISQTTIWPIPKSGLASIQDFKKFKPKALTKHNSITTRYKAYLKQMKQKGEKPRAWAFLPHILYKGTINIAKEKIITIK